MTKLPDTDLDKALRRLRSRLRKLPATEGRPLARRNARRAVLSAMSLMRAAVDRLYPRLVVGAGKPKTRLTVRGRQERLKRRGLRYVTDSDAGHYAMAGVPVTRLKYKVVRNAGTALETVDTVIDLYVPGWAVAIGLYKPSQLRAAKRSRTLQRAALATAALSEGVEPS